VYDSAPNILDQAVLLHGPRDLLARYIAHADDSVRELGVRLRISRDFDRLVALNARHRGSWPKILPSFDPKYSDLSGDTAFFIEGIDQSGDTVVTSAGRLYDHGDRSLASDLRSLRVLYDNPAPHVAAGESVVVSAPFAEHIWGRAMFSAVVWVRPDYRRHGLTKIVPRLTRAYALAQWNTPVFWMMIAPDLDKIGVTRAYGSWHVDGRLAMHLPSLRDDFEVLFCSMGQDALIRDIANSVYETSVGDSRRIDTPMPNISLPLPRQGMSTLS
jgi:hypothetical protein